MLAVATPTGDPQLVESPGIAVVKNNTTATHSNHPQTGKRHGHPQPVRHAVFDASKQSKIRLSTSGCGKDRTHEGSVLTPQTLNKHFATTTIYNIK